MKINLKLSRFFQNNKKKLKHRMDIMHACKDILIILTILTIYITSYGQSISISTNNRKITMSKNTLEKYKNRKSYGSQYFYATFEKVPDPQTLGILKKSNIDIL